MNRLWTFLAEEILWGLTLGVALLAAILTVFVLGAAQTKGNLLFYTFSLGIVALGGVLVGMRALRHPFWNGLVYGLFCTLWSVALLALSTWGTEGQPPSAPALLGAAFNMVILVLPQALAGAWIASSYRRIRQMGERAAGKNGRAPTAPQGDTAAKQTQPLVKKKNRRN
ncbi:MAG: hypothetical protein JXA37_14140 [Chloroflexia bacterium]|nr:hypothetical protein [Chloroflexia bacterium]